MQAYDTYRYLKFLGSQNLSISYTPPPQEKKNNPANFRYFEFIIEIFANYSYK